MNLPFALPDWVPWWVPLAILLPLILYALAFLAMPFSVLGLKGRIEGIEGRLDEIQGEIRSLSLRLPEPVRGGSPETFRRSTAARAMPFAPPQADDEPPLVQRPMTAAPRSPAPEETAIPPSPYAAPHAAHSSPIVPIPPVSRDLAGQPRRFIRPVTRPDASRPDSSRQDPPAGGGRAEPRIDWPR